MGASASIPGILKSSKVRSGQELIAKTKDVREMSNALFQFMFTSWDQKEIWEIANNPGDYVIALSDMITAQFHIIGYTTKRNQIGEIYFMKYDKLKPPSGDGDRNIVKQRENAQIIAFYFIRLMQFMGAMLLVVKDVSFPVIDSNGLERNIGAPSEASRPIINQPSVVLSRFRPPGQRGGASKFPQLTPLGPYEFLRYYLRQISSDTVTNYSTKYGVTLDPRTTYMLTENLFFQYSAPNPLPSQVSSSNSNQKFILITKTQSTRAELAIQDVSITSLFPGTLDKYIAPADNQLTTSQQQLGRYHTNVTLSMKGSRSKNPHTATVIRTETEAKKEKYHDGVEYSFDSGTNVDVLLAQFDAQKDFLKILEMVVLFAIRSNKENKAIQLYKIKVEEESGTKEKDIGKMPTSIRNPALDEMYQVLRTPTDNKPIDNQPHCIARALQLLDGATIQATTPISGKSKICKFAIGKETGPISLASYKPLKSVAQLFGKINPIDFKKSQEVLSAFVGSQATKTPIGISEMVKMEQKEEAIDLSIALDKLAKAFEFVKEGESKISGFDQIQVSRPTECKTSDEMVINNAQTVSQLQGVAHQLMAYHINNTIEISKFLNILFNIKRSPDGTWKVEGPKTEILYAGFPALDQLTEQARDLLVDYYSGCEQLYQTGVNAWKESPGVKPETPAPVPSAPVPSAPVPSAPAAPPIVPAAAPVAPVPAALARGGYRR